MSARKLSYVPVNKPNAARINMAQFFINIHLLGVFEVPHALTHSIIGGNPNARAVEHSAPIKDINKFSNGTSSAITTVKYKKTQIYFLFYLEKSNILISTHMCTEPTAF